MIYSRPGTRKVVHGRAVHGCKEMWKILMQLLLEKLLMSEYPQKIISY